MLVSFDYVSSAGTNPGLNFADKETHVSAAIVMLAI
jgi:hypothetical protein